MTVSKKNSIHPAILILIPFLVLCLWFSSPPANAQSGRPNGDVIASELKQISRELKNTNRTLRDILSELRRR